MQHDNIAVVLRNTIALPRIEDEENPSIYMGFLSSVEFFVAVAATLTSDNAPNNGQIYSPDTLAQLQHQLQEGPAFVPYGNEVQTTDIRIAQQ